MVDLDASENRNSAVARVGDDRWGKAMVERCIQHRANVTVPRANVRRDREHGPNDRDPRDRDQNDRAPDGLAEQGSAEFEHWKLTQRRRRSNQILERLCP